MTTSTTAIPHEATLAAAKTLAGFNGEAFIFEPPKMDGVTRSATASSVYLRQAQEILEAVDKATRHAAALGNPVPDVSL